MYAISFLPKNCKSRVSTKSVKQPEKKYRGLASTMKKQSLHTVEDSQFGRGSPYAWPGDIHEARRFLARCGDLKLSANYLECDFYNVAGVKDVKKRFKGVTEWPLPYLVASAAYCFLSWGNRTAEKICNVGRIDAFDWKNLCRVFLIFGEPLFQMIEKNRLYKPNKEAIREGFIGYLQRVICRDDEIYDTIQWSHERGASWFQIHERGFDEVDRPDTYADYRLGRVSSENLLGCLELASVLASVNETVAWAGH